MWNFDVYNNVIVASYFLLNGKIIPKIDLRCKHQKAPSFMLHFQFLVVHTKAKSWRILVLFFVYCSCLFTIDYWCSCLRGITILVLALHTPLLPFNLVRLKIAFDGHLRCSQYIFHETKIFKSTVKLFHRNVVNFCTHNRFLRASLLKMLWRKYGLFSSVFLSCFLVVGKMLKWQS